MKAIDCSLKPGELTISKLGLKMINYYISNFNNYQEILICMYDYKHLEYNWELHCLGSPELHGSRFSRVHGLTSHRQLTSLAIQWGGG